MLCQECHHLPSGRIADHGAACYCECHDVADAAPELLKALENITDLVERCGDSRKDKPLVDAAYAAMAKARKE